MEDQIVSDTSSIPRSESKLLVGDKRSSDEFGEESELGRRRVKMRDLESLFRSEAANVASQWLELLYQDTKGRLAALQRSKKRVRAVIHTELPFLISQEFSSNQENDQYAMKNSAAGCSGNADAEVHQARWSALFHQMDKALSEEEKQLESWLNQIQEMKLHCEWGLEHSSCNVLHGSQRMGTLESDPSVTSNE